MDKKTIPFAEKQAILDAIRAKESFSVVGCAGRMGVAVEWVEKAIENEGLTCRIYTNSRAAAMAGVLVPTGVTQVLGVAAAVGIAVHNLATWNPDYEIMKRPIDHALEVSYMKEVPPGEVLQVK